jgi:predicted SnoaL-like aldol condensation-catalyzing enzyme
MRGALAARANGGQSQRLREISMKITTIRRALLTLVLLMGGLGAAGAQTVMTAQEQANLKLVLDWWRECIEGRHLDLTSNYQSDDYIQHNINVPTGREGFVSFFKRMGEPVNPIPDKLSNPPVVQFAKGDFVLLVWEREGKDPADASKTYKYNTYDLLRIENGKVQEHWDYAEKIPGVPRGAAPEGTDYAAVKFDFSEQEKRNIEVADVEMRDILQYGHLELAEKVMAPGYIQHNPNVPTGRAAFVEFFGRFAKPEPLKPEWKNEPTLTIANGPYVFYLVKRLRQDPDYPDTVYPAFWFDMLRVEDGMIQEHWDAAQKNPPRGPAN